MLKKISPEIKNKKPLFVLFAVLSIVAVFLVIILAFKYIPLFQSARNQTPPASQTAFPDKEMLDLLSAPQGAKKTPPVPAEVMKNLDATKSSPKSPSADIMNLLSAPSN